MTANSSQGTGIQVLVRAAQILRSIRPDSTLNVTELSKELNVGRSTLHRYLATMEQVSFVERTHDGGYALGPLLAQLGVQSLSALQIVQIASGVMHRLSRDADETVVLSIWGGDGAVVTRVAQPDKLININVRQGTVLPEKAAQTAIFRHHLSGEGRPPKGRAVHDSPQDERIAEYLETGFYRQDSYVPGLTTLACPIFNPTGITATLALVGTTNGITEDLLTPKSQLLIDGAKELSDALGA